MKKQISANVSRKVNQQIRLIFYSHFPTILVHQGIQKLLVIPILMTIGLLDFSVGSLLTKNKINKAFHEMGNTIIERPIYNISIKITLIACCIWCVLVRGYCNCSCRLPMLCGEK